MNGKQLKQKQKKVLDHQENETDKRDTDETETQNGKPPRKTE